MRRRLFGFATVLVLSAGLISPAAATAAGGSLRFQRLRVGTIDPQILPFLIDPGRQLNVVVEMTDQPVAGMVGDASDSGTTVTPAQKSARRTQIKAHQQSVVDAVRKSGGLVVSQMQDAYNGIHVHVRASQIAALAAMPGVASVHLARVYRPSLTHSVPFVGAPAAWSATGFTGQGVSIAVIDSGIDFYHADFGGSGKPSDYEYGLAHDTVLPATNADGTTAFPSAKVTAGYDFVGDAYDAAAPTGSPATIPVPDGNPLDCNSHGTHTASTAAGFGELSNGATYNGPYNANIYSTTDFLIGPGVAPGATIMAYKVFGCEGATDVVPEAINKAVADGADVISMSLGSDFGTNDTPDAVAANNAARAGVVVVAASGNEGASGYMTGTPASATRVLSVAGVDSNESFPGATIELPGGGITGLNANNGPLPVSGTLHVVPDGGGGIGLGCDASDYTGTAGEIVVTTRGVCDRVARAKLGQAAGAAAVIMVNNASGLPPFEGPIAGVTIPFIGVEDVAGPALLAADTQPVTIDSAGLLTNPSYKEIVDFSSRGPRFGDSALKPEISAPAVSILAAGMGTGDGVLVDSGTSMATPHVAGIAALVVEAHPTWSVNEVKASIMSTADISSAHILDYQPAAAGSGVARADRAVTTAAIALTRNHLDSLSFGYKALSRAYRATQSFVIENKSSAAITYRLTSAFDGDSAGAHLSVSPAQVTVAPHAVREVFATLTMSAAAVKDLPTDDTLGGLGPGALMMVQGVVTATPTAARTGVYALNVPFLFVPRGLSSVTAGPAAPYKSKGGVATSSLLLRNKGIHDGAADVYSWGIYDGDRRFGLASVRAVGVETLPAAACDPSIPDSDRCLVFAINGWQRWSNVSAMEFDIAVDTTGDGVPDYIVAELDSGEVMSGSYDGIAASFIFDMSGNMVDAWLADAPLNGSVVELPVLASDLGLTDASAPFTYSVVGVDLIHGTVNSVPGSAVYSAYSPSISNGQFVPLASGASATLPLSVDLTAVKAAPARGWMIVSLDNANGAYQASLVPLGKLPHK